MTETNHGVLAEVDKVAPKTSMHPLVEKMLAKDPTAETLEKILGLQRKWEEDEAKRAYASALVELKRALPPFLLKDKKVEYEGKTGEVQYTHTSLASAMEQVTPLLSQFGFSLTWRPGTNEKGVTVTAILMHRLGHSDTATLSAPADLSGRKSPAQGIASTITLLERYSALALLGLSSRDMTEPTGEPAPASQDKIDTARNMRAMSDLAKSGKNKDAVEKFLGKRLDQWTTKDLDKLRAWIAPAAPSAELISKAEADDLRALVTRWQLTPAQLGAILVEEIGRKPASAADIKKAEYAKIKKLFDGLELGMYSLVNGKLEKPPEPEPESDAPTEYAKEMPEDKDIPF